MGGDKGKGTIVSSWKLLSEEGRKQKAKLEQELVDELTEAIKSLRDCYCFGGGDRTYICECAGTMSCFRSDAVFLLRHIDENKDCD